MTYQLAASARTAKGEKARFAGQLPAIIYGANQPSESVSLNLIDFLKLYKAAGEASLIDLLVDGQSGGKVIVQDVQQDPVSDKIIHVDLRRIDMNKVMTATVQLRFVGEASIIKSSGGTLVTTVHKIEVKCLPKDLVSHLDVDVSSLVDYQTVIKIKDLKLPAGITVVSPHAEDLVVKAAQAITEEEIKKMEEAATASVDLTKLEVTGKKKEEEAEEGAAEEAGKEGADAKAAPEKKEEKKKEEKK